MIEKHLGEVHDELTIIARAQKPNNGYLAYYWVRCSCGNVKRYRYDQVRKVSNCGMCEDFKNSNVLEALRAVNYGKNE